MSYVAKYAHPRDLTDEILMKEVLYVAGPTGLRQLKQLLESKQVQYTGDGLQRLLVKGLEAGRLVTKVIPFGGEMIQLYSIPGLGLG